MEGTGDVVLLQTDFGLVDGERHYVAMVAPGVFRRFIVAFISGSKPRGPKDSPFDPSVVARLGFRTISDSAIKFTRVI